MIGLWHLFIAKIQAYIARVFVGDGQSCHKTPALDDLTDQYTEQALQGPLLCNIRFPTDGPGYIDDPTGSVNHSAAKQVMLHAYPGVGLQSLQYDKVCHSM